MRECIALLKLQASLLGVHRRFEERGLRETQREVSYLTMVK